MGSNTVGLSQASAIRNSRVSAFQGLKYTASTGNTICAWLERSAFQGAGLEEFHKGVDGGGGGSFSPPLF
jgi:hypothetical protein